MCEARNASGSVTAQYFPRGESLSGTSYYCTKDYLGSVRELIDSTGTVQAQYSYDPYGRVSKLQGTLNSDFQYAGYYLHAPSGLNLTLARAYNAQVGRFINRDPIEEQGGTNLYCYVQNDPVVFSDVQGLLMSPPVAPPVETPPTRDWPHKPPTGGGGDDDPEAKCKRRRDRDHPPPAPPPGGGGGGGDSGCNPPALGTDPTIVTYSDCWWWCIWNCPPQKWASCQAGCGGYPGSLGGD
jgi:RHS repeat-associated protein